MQEGAEAAAPAQDQPRMVPDVQMVSDQAQGPRETPIKMVQPRDDPMEESKD